MVFLDVFLDVFLWFLDGQVWRGKTVTWVGNELNEVGLLYL